MKELLDADLPSILKDFYTGVKPINGELYSIQTLKCIRAALNRYFKSHRNIDILKDSRFVEINEMFQSITVEAKKSGKGAVKSTKPIAPEELQIINQYFKHNHMVKPQPKILQRTLLFYIIYFFCHRGRENLYQMEKDWFNLITEYDGKQYVIQQKDEHEKNHGPNDTAPTDDGKMYAIPGENLFKLQKK